MHRLALLVALLACAACRTTDARVAHVTPRESSHGPRVLAVVAHPADETAFAAALYQITTRLDGVCDLAVITNGEGGFKYATLAERTYGLELTDEAVGRAELPTIRRRELEDSARVLAVRDVWFLGEQDHRYTTDLAEVLGPAARVWDLARVRAELDELLARGRYDLVFTLAPTADTHAHHKAATVLALEAALRRPERERPVVLCTRVVDADDPKPLVVEAGVPAIELASGAAPFEVDRRQTFGFKQSLDWRVVVNWAIAAHKSQGTMQLAMNRGDREQFYLFRADAPDATTRARPVFDALRAAAFPLRTYGPTAGTNTKP